MMPRRALLAAAMLPPLMAHAQDKAKGFYASGTKQRMVRFAGSDEIGRAHV